MNRLRPRATQLYPFIVAILSTFLSPICAQPPMSALLALDEVGMQATASTDGTYEIADTVDATHDSLLAKKRAMMDQKMQKRNQKRQHQDLLRQKKRADEEDPNSNTNKFWSEYKLLQQQVQAVLDQVNTTLAEQSNPTAAFKKELADALLPLAATLDAMQKMAAGAAYYLPSYDSRSAAVTLRDLRSALATTKEQVAPKKKFSFKEKRAAAKAAKAAKKLAKEQAQKEEKTDATPVPAVEKDPSPVVKSTLSAYVVIDYTISDKKGETVTVDPGDLEKWAKEEEEEVAGSAAGSASNTSSASKSRDVVLTNLEDCVVFLGDTMSALRVTNVKRCHVYGGPVAGSLLLEGCEDCVFWLASRQIRLHHAERCTFHLRVMSNPIIEDCSGLIFSPYNLMYEGLTDMLVQAGLGSTVKDMWSTVKDFKWHRATHSPNWSEGGDVTTWALEPKHGSVTLLQEQLVLEGDTERNTTVDLNKGFEH